MELRNDHFSDLSYSGDNTPVLLLAKQIETISLSVRTGLKRSSQTNSADVRSFKRVIK